jgi:TonB family protein
MRRPLIYLFAAVLTFAVGITVSIILHSVNSPSAEKSGNPGVQAFKAPAQRISEPAQGEPGSISAINGGVLNGKATSLPTPAYPAIARAAHASGTVTVWVLVDESGRVISSHAVGGHPLLQNAAEQAAREARFTPTLLSGQPVKVKGIITFNFVA